MRRAALPLLLAAAAAIPAARAEDRTDTLPDGSKETYGVDAEGRRQGQWRAFYPGGAVRFRCNYDRGERDGFFDEFYESGRTKVHVLYRGGRMEGEFEEKYEDGTVRLAARYREGLLDGPRVRSDAGKPAWRQEWSRGRLVRLEGIDPHPRPVDAVRTAVRGILGPPAPPRGDGAPPDFEAGRGRAIRLLRAFRYLAGVPWEDVVLDPKLDPYVEGAARVCSLLGTITHTPKNPGMPPEEFRVAARGCGSSNLATTGDLELSVRMYMDDSDATNIDRCGHRRWCLNPRMTRTAFGACDGFSAMWSADSGRKAVPRLEFLAWPPPGYVPEEFFGARHAWSFTPSVADHAVPDGVKAVVQPLDAAYDPAGAPLVLDYLHVDRTGFGAPGACVIFRPAKIEVAPGRAYLATVSGLEVRKGSKASPEVRWLVEFAVAAE